MDIKQAVLAAVLGGLAGALINFLLNWQVWRDTQQRSRTDITLKLIDYFFSIYSEVGVVKGLLQTPASLKSSPTELNRVKKIGDWYNLVATLRSENSVDKELLLKAVIMSEMEKFHELVQSAKSIANELDDAWKWWPNMHALFSRN